jgi:predicted esterase
MVAAVRVATVAVALACLVVPGALARRHHRPPPRPNLVISQGGANASGGRIAANFVVANVGSAAAGRSRAALTLRVGGGVRTLARPRVGRLSAGDSARIDASAPIPSGLGAGSYAIRACADDTGAVHESSESDNCRRLGRLIVNGMSPGPGSGSTVPSNPVSFQADTVFTLQSAATTYWVDVPPNYDTSHHTPTELLVWLHGCGGEASGDIYTVSPPGARPYISIAVGGREDDCWDPNSDQTKVLAAISDVETHFNIDRHQVVLGGYSSGGDLAYRTAFYHSLMFSGVLAENTSPFRDTGSTATQSLAAAQWKFNVVHLAHTEDEVYPIDGVVNEIDTMRSAGFPVQLIERPGTHYDNSTATSGTDFDLQTYLLPHLGDGWRSP